MRSRYRVAEPDRAHFVTSTIVEWLPILASAACCNILVRSLAHCREHKRLRIYAWVILDNYFHAILAAPDLSAVLRDLKSFTAMQLVQQLESERREWLLNQLRYYRAPNKPNEFQIWQEGSHPQIIRGDAMCAITLRKTLSEKLKPEFHSARKSRSTTLHLENWGR
jgi:REP element-mobilizing transposase RayT